MGWKDYNITTATMAKIYSSPKENILGALENEYCKLFIDGELADIIVWKHGEYQAVKDKPIKNHYIGDTVRARNPEQRMAIDLLRDKDIKVKLLTSVYGGGKTYLILSYALEAIGRGDYDKIVFMRNNIIVSNTKDIGFLPGDLWEKEKLWCMCLADHLGGEEMLDNMVQDGIIEAMPISHCRGRSLRNSIVFVDESENLTKEHVQLLLSRIEESSEIIFCGDMKQVDGQVFSDNSGISVLKERLTGNPLFGTVQLVKSERGPVPRLCDLLD